MKKQFFRIYKCLARPGSNKDSAYRQGAARALTVNVGIGCCLAVATLVSFADAHAQSTDDSLRIYAVNIWLDPPQSWGPGRGVYLGKGLVITAAHVVGLTRQTKPSVRIAG